MTKMWCPEKKKWVLTDNDVTVCYESKTKECKNCQFNKEVMK